MRLLILISLLFMALVKTGVAASVEWDVFYTYSGTGTGLGIDGMLEVGSRWGRLDVYITPEYSDVDGGYKLHFSDEGGHPGLSCGNLVAAKAGDVVNAATTRFRSDGEYLYHARIDDGGYGGSATLPIGSESVWAYVAFVCSDEYGYLGGDPSYVYGWLLLGIDNYGNISLVESAYDRDGGPMIVGGGSAIPEPSGALLLLLGGALLTLRRRRGIRGMSR